MKIILSRKGSDSASGGYPSPHFAENGRLLVLPIPEEKEKNNINSGRTYADLRFDDRLSYLDVMKQLGINKFDSKFVHLDPDINYSIVSNRNQEWRGLFGQSGNSQTHLRNKGVEKGDLFLFFGWFRDVVNTDNGYQYVSGTDRHIIWGYLQVGEIESIHRSKYCEKWKRDHPHYYYRNRKNNTGYIARDTLSFAPNLPGYGVFNYRDSLVLTCPGQKKRSIWQLPKYFHPNYGTIMSHHANATRWEVDNKHCILHSVGRGQEFVIEGNEKINRWAKQLLEDE